MEIQVDEVLVGKLYMDNLGHKRLGEFSLGHWVEEGVDKVLGQKENVEEEDEEEAVVWVDMVSWGLCDFHQAVGKKEASN